MRLVLSETVQGRAVPYNAGMGDQDLPQDQGQDRSTAGAGDGAERPAIDVSMLPALPVHPRSQRSPASNVGRWATFGCVAVMLMLVVLLAIGVNLTKRAVWMAHARAQQRLVESLPTGLASGERMRTERNLQRFRARLEIVEDPIPAMGEFLRLVTASLDDDVLDGDELADINRFMEESLDQPGTGAP